MHLFQQPFFIFSLCGCVRKHTHTHIPGGRFEDCFPQRGPHSLMSLPVSAIERGSEAELIGYQPGRQKPRALSFRAIFTSEERQEMRANYFKMCDIVL